MVLAYVEANLNDWGDRKEWFQCEVNKVTTCKVTGRVNE